MSASLTSLNKEIIFPVSTFTLTEDFILLPWFLLPWTVKVFLADKMIKLATLTRPNRVLLFIENPWYELE